ncbi:hypothetical protein I5E19_02685 [Pseudomonas aeruginosa]|nr:hypothetical protein [Pseudomonas aeruginosa]
MDIKAAEITKCKECGSADLYWFSSMRNTGQAQDGRLSMHEVACDFVLGCRHCSETLAVVSADRLAEQMTKTQGKKTRQARCISMRPGMGEVTLLMDNGRVPGFMDPGCTVDVHES